MDNGELFVMMDLDKLMPTLSAGNKDTLELQNMMTLPQCKQSNSVQVLAFMIIRYLAALLVRFMNNHYPLTPNDAFRRHN